MADIVARDVTVNTPDAPREQDPVVVTFNKVRAKVKDVAQDLALVKRAVMGNPHKDAPAQPVAPGEDRGEVIANLTLAYRHLEDASMRLGKAIQARDGGVSVYDASTAVMNA